MKINREEIQILREKLRKALPPLNGHHVSNEVLSACFSTLIERSLILIIQEIQRREKVQVSGDAARVIMEKLEHTIGQALSEVLVEYVPDATAFHAFLPPSKSTE